MASYYQKDTVYAIVNLATATIHDKEAVANLKTANATLTTTKSTLTAELASVNKELVTALEKINSTSQRMQGMKVRGKYTSIYPHQYHHGFQALLLVMRSQQSAPQSQM